MTNKFPTQGAVEALHGRQSESNYKKWSDKYETSYKNILWIDDRDANDGDNTPLKWMLRYCDPSTCMQIEQIDSFYDAVKKIVENHSKYDLVIFDINLAKGFGLISDDKKKEIDKHFRDFHISTDQGIDPKIAGYYLFKLLLHVGYPLNRMLIFSAHSTKENAKEKLNGLIIDDRIFLDKHDLNNKKKKLDIENKFFAIEKHDYYRVRRLVYQACNYWISKLKDSEWEKDPYNIPFNKIYYDNQNDPIKADSFIRMLELVKLLFPVSAPQENQKTNTSEQEKLYFKALQTVVSFHEESAKMRCLNDYPKLKRYHSCVRNFRNWSAHNRMEQKLSADKFALLFCISLRTYFSWSSDKSLSDELLEYEKIYGFSCKSSINIDNTEARLLSLWKDVHSKLQNKYYSDLEEAIRELGKTDKCTDMSEYLFVSLWCPDYLFDFKFTEVQISFKTSQVLLCVDRQKVENICYETESFNNKSSDICFKRFCYQWVINNK